MTGAVNLVVYGGNDVGAALVASGREALWIRPPEPAAFPVSYVGNGEVADTARKIFGDAVFHRLWKLSEANLGLVRRFLPGDEVAVRWDHGNEVGWLPSGPPRLSAKAATLRSVTALGNFRYRLDLGTETLETAALVLADELLPPKLFPALRETWLLPACTELWAKPGAAMPEGLRLEHAGVDYAFRHGGHARFGSFRGLQDDGAIARPAQPSARGVEALTRHYAAWIDGPAEAKVYEAALSCDGLPIVGPLHEAPGVFVVGAFAARERNFRTAAVKAVLDGLGGKRAPEVEPYSPRRFA